ncbi:MAG: glycosyltransferase [Bacteroidales bacterium]|nr:glycosyltransferase [Bacteroidales bacterium]
MKILLFIIDILQYAFMAYLGIAALYFFMYSFAGVFKQKKPVQTDDKKRRFAVLIPGYKEDQVIVEVAKHALNQDYPSELYDVVIIADQFQQETLDALDRLPILVNVVVFEKSSKSKALNNTLAWLPKDKYDAVMILDADNMMAPDVLTKMNQSMNCGFQAVQGHRLAKNTDTHFSRLDGISEEINNHIFRKGHRILGLSSALIGSGMAFDYNLFKDYMATIDSYGEDKELEFKLMKDDYKIEYVEDALIYDEKVSQSKVFVRQRTRWLFNQFLYGKLYGIEGFKLLFTKGNVDFFDKMFQQLLPPRILLLGMITIITILSLLFNPLSLSYIWIAIASISFLAFSFAVPRRFYSWDTMKAALFLPFGFILMFRSLSRLSEAKKGFGATQHTVTSIKTDKEKKDKNP